jgi:hypothetical protein
MILFFSFFITFSVFHELSVNGVELECEYYDYDEDYGCGVQGADLSLKTIGTSFTFSGTQEQKQHTFRIRFQNSGKVSHLPRNLFKVFTKLNKLQIKNSDIPILQNNFFKPEFSKLKRLELTGDSIKIIEEKTFRQLKDLTEIDLEHNEIRSLPSKLFQKNRKLKWVILGRNKIKIIHPETFKNLNQLIYVGLWLNECFNQEIGCQSQGCDRKLDHAELERELQRCFENHAKSLHLLNEGENDKEA